MERTQVFKLYKADLPKGKIKSISFPDLSSMEFNKPSPEQITVTFELEDGTTYACLVGRTIIITD